MHGNIYREYIGETLNNEACISGHQKYTAFWKYSLLLLNMTR